MQFSQLTDEQLARQAIDGQESGFQALYERYVGVLFDFLRRVLRTNDEAIDATRAMFVEAADALERSSEPPSSVHTWLYGLAHRQATGALRRSRTEERAGEELLMQLPDTSSDQADPEMVAEYRDVAQWVWQALRELPVEDQEALLLNIRDGLDAGQIAEVLGRRRDAVQASLAAARDAFEDKFTAICVLARGRGACAELDDIAVGFGVSPRLHDQVSEHVATCPICQRTRSRYVSAAEVLAGLAEVPLSPEVRSLLWRQIQDRMVTSPVAEGATVALPAFAAGFLARLSGDRGGWREILLSPGIIALAIFLGVGIIAFLAAYGIGSRLRDNSAATTPTPIRQVAPPTSTESLIVTISPVASTSPVPLTPTTALAATEAPAPAIVPTTAPPPPPTREPLPTATSVPQPTPLPTAIPPRSQTTSTVAPATTATTEAGVDTTPPEPTTEAPAGPTSTSAIAAFTPLAATIQPLDTVVAPTAPPTLVVRTPVPPTVIPPTSTSSGPPAPPTATLPSAPTLAPTLIPTAPQTLVRPPATLLPAGGAPATPTTAPGFIPIPTPRP